MISFVLDGTHYSYSDEHWAQLNQGIGDAPTPVWQYIVRRQNEQLAQDKDELLYRNDIISSLSDVVDGHRDRISELEKERALGWETKPMKAKRAKTLEQP